MHVVGFIIRNVSLSTSMWVSHVLRRGTETDSKGTADEWLLLCNNFLVCVVGTAAHI